MVMISAEISQMYVPSFVQWNGDSLSFNNLAAVCASRNELCKITITSAVLQK